MQISFEYRGNRYVSDLDKGLDLSSTLGGEQELRAWGVPPVAAEPVSAGDWVGRVSAGAPVNFFDITFNPHGNGTHTECFGHIDQGHQSLNRRLRKHHFLCRVLRLQPRQLEGDKVIHLTDLKAKINRLECEALIIQTGAYEAGHDFSNSNPAYFQPGLMRWVREQGVQHFLTDLPSVDREEDGGALAAHKEFWDYPNNVREEATITELLYCPEPLKEGLYLLNLQTAAFENDASPSRPVLFPVKKL